MTRVVVAGALANKPGNSGEAWVRTTWLRGLQRLGLEVWFVEQLSPSSWGDETAACLTWFEQMVERFGLDDVAALVGESDELLAGAAAARDAAVEGGDLLVNISGHLQHSSLLRAFRHRAYVDLDPAYTQVWHEQGADLGLAAHDTHFSVGLNVGSAGCTVPTGGFRWHPVLPPVLLDEWAPLDGATCDRFTTVASWRGGYGTLVHDGVTYGPKAHVFRRIMELPGQVASTLELAVEMHAADDADRRSLLAHGWQVVAASDVTHDPDAFRHYVRSSGAELSVAQPAYVGTRSGWFSDRTAHYLAAGRPAVVQDTGVPLRPEAGLLFFDSSATAARAAADIVARYEDHRMAARAFAESHLDASTVLARFMDQALHDPPTLR